MRTELLNLLQFFILFFISSKLFQKAMKSWRKLQLLLKKITLFFQLQSLVLYC